MTAKEFTQKLFRLTPSIEDFLNLGYKHEIAEQLMLEYKCIAKESKLDEINIADELLLLVQNYDCSKVQIGIVSFFKEIYILDDYIVLGEVEGDILALRKETLEIHVLDNENPQWIIWTCASSGKHFLDAMICAAEFFSIRIKNTHVAKNREYTRENVNKCASKAGGDAYQNFYSVLLGLDE